MILTKGLSSIGDGAFRECEGLTPVVISDGITSIGEKAFYQCRNLSQVTIHEGITRIGDGAFSGCESLTSATFGNTGGWHSRRGSHAKCEIGVSLHRV